jgi:hypothetical protein
MTKKGYSFLNRVNLELRPLTWDDLLNNYKSMAWKFEDDVMMFEISTDRVLTVWKDGRVTVSYYANLAETRMVIGENKTPEQMELIIRGLIGGRK